MDNELKIKIINLLQEYVETNNVSQEEIAQRAEMNVSYVNALVKGKQNVGNTIIKDQYYVKIAELIGLDLEKKYWQHVDTEQYEAIMVELLSAKHRGYEKLIIGESGCGKTYTIEQFVKLYPEYTYRITVSSEHNLKNILNELGERMNIRYGGDNVFKIKQIAKKMKSYKSSGKKCVIIIDEGENLKLSGLRAMKSLYDSVNKYCPIVLVGTPQLLRKIERLKEKDEDGMPQLYRRFRAGICEVKTIDKSTMYEPFLSDIQDEGVKEVITSLADNYGELNRYVESSLREADEMGEPLTETFFSCLFRA